MRGLCFLLLATVLVTPSSALARTWYITPDGMGDDPIIGAGIDSASTGDTVLVACGTYYEAFGMQGRRYSPE